MYFQPEPCLLVSPFVVQHQTACHGDARQESAKSKKTRNGVILNSGLEVDRSLVVVCSLQLTFVSGQAKAHHVRPGTESDAHDNRRHTVNGRPRILRRPAGLLQNIRSG